MNQLNCFQYLFIFPFNLQDMALNDTSGLWTMEITENFSRA